MQGNFWLVENQEQSLLFGQGLGNALVESLIAGGGAKEHFKVSPQAIGLGGGRILTIALQLMVEVPEVALEIVQQLAMKIDKGREFLK